MFSELPDTDTDVVKFYPIEYNEPKKKDMAIIIVYFNATRSVRIAQNILMIKQMLENANIPYYIGELSINKTPFLFRETDNIFHYTSSDYMFYKENLINLVEDRIPEKYAKICILDADVLFDNADWYSILSQHLDNVDICQPFINAYWLGIEYNKDIVCKRQNCIVDQSNGHPGFAWAFKRSILKQCKLPDFCLIGSGDLIFYGSTIVRDYDKIDCKYSYLISKLIEYNSKIKQLKYKTGFLRINIFHLYHGSRSNRMYSDRHFKIKEKIESLGLKYISDIIDYDSNGVRCWKEPYKEEMNKLVKEYLCNRKDDKI